MARKECQNWDGLLHELQAKWRNRGAEHAAARVEKARQVKEQQAEALVGKVRQGRPGHAHRPHRRDAVELRGARHAPAVPAAAHGPDKGRPCARPEPLAAARTRTSLPSSALAQIQGAIGPGPGVAGQGPGRGQAGAGQGPCDQQHVTSGKNKHMSAFFGIS